ncbi:1,4-dihydroxy-6-naphthoate synthase [Neorhodopirellula pilleata]|uniref:1,4-dihydroxy-6-naphtoate synthase n=1 Tax=Neorhodopirellula pilleata TaxID=2714738 RepID=A0A5C5ZY42_9BACT|nr:1,4-dihydroxy-6-naphthoate synthase [Neorhodopirellula pilleata]TWT92209.1 1,4-dihydroxy-6-naphtoate synthase [Neorhodopirellula pilleata]
MSASHQVVVGSGRRIHLGISTCPNDTFAFAGLLENRVDTRGLQFVIDLLDIDELNQGLFGGRFDVLKASFHAALLASEETIVLPVGSALGFGVGPLLLSAKPGMCPGATSDSPEAFREHALTLCPGEHTTAKLLFDLFYPESTRVEHVVFSDIMPSLAAGTADFGVCIHEGRFTYQESGLHCVEDLGERWEATTGSPLPLGGLLMRTRHDEATMHCVVDVISDSLRLARDAPETALPAMRRYAQAMDDAILMQHADLYVNEWTHSLGEVGRAALDKLSEMAKKSGKVGDQSPGLRVLG